MKQSRKSCSTIGRRAREEIEAQMRAGRDIEAVIKKDLSVLAPTDRIPEPARRALSACNPKIYTDGLMFLEDMVQQNT